MSPLRRLVPRRLARRKRAAVLLLLGTIFVLNGWIMLDQAALFAGNDQAVTDLYDAHLDALPIRSWGIVFITVGTLAALSGLFGRLPAWCGFAGLQLLSLFWGLLFAASWAQNGYARAWVGFVQWAAIAGVVAIISDWDDPPPNPRATEDALAVLDRGSS